MFRDGIRLGPELRMHRQETGLVDKRGPKNPIEACTPWDTVPCCVCGSPTKLKAEERFPHPPLDSCDCLLVGNVVHVSMFVHLFHVAFKFLVWAFLLTELRSQQNKQKTYFFEIEVSQAEVGSSMEPYSQAWKHMYAFLG